MKKIYAFLIGLSVSLTGFSQPCLPEGIEFTTQAQIDSFQVDYPGCTEIGGNVSIFGDNINNLNGLNVLTSIGGFLQIGDYYYGNPSLTSLTGLDNLTTIGGGFNISYNDALNDLTGLDNLASIGGGFWITFNDTLTCLTGLNSLTSVDGNLMIYSNELLINMTGLNNLISVGGDVNIGMSFTFYNFGNPSLVNFSGLENLNLIGGRLYIHYNDLLNSLNGLNNLTSIGGKLDIGDSPSLTDLTGLNNLTTIGGDLFISRTSALTSLTGLESLTTIGGNLVIGGGDSYVGNQALTSVTGLQNVASIGGNLHIVLNYNLTSLTGLNKDNLKSVADIYVVYNSSLSACAVKSLCDYLIQPDPSSTIEIHDNSSGCDSREEVEAACTFGLFDNPTPQTHITLYPSPSSTTINITLASITPGNNTTLDICNVNARKVISRRINELNTVIDINALPPGVYFARITTDKTVMVSKFIKQ